MNDDGLLPFQRRLAQIMNVPPYLAFGYQSWVRRRRGKRLHKVHWKRRR